MRIKDKTEDGHVTSGIFKLYESLPEHVKPLQKSVPPYMKASHGGYGYQGVTLYDELLDRVQCHICGRWFKSIGIHVSIHDMKAWEYKKRFGLCG